MSFGLSFICVLVVFAHLTETRVLILRDINDEPLILDHTESQEEIPQTVHPIIFESTPKRIRSKKKTILQYGRQIYHLDNYEDMRELRSKLKPKSISYDYFSRLIKSSNRAKNTMSNYLNEFLVVSETPQRLCFRQQCEEDMRKYSKKRKKKIDVTEWEQKMKQIPTAQDYMKRFRIVDNIHNSVRDPKFGSEEYPGKKKGSKKHKKKKNVSVSDESKDSRSVEANSKMSNEKEKRISSEEIETKHEKASTEDSFEKSKNLSIDSKSEEDIPKKKSKKKKKHSESTDNTKRKTISIEDTYFMQGNKIFHSSGKSKKKYHDESRRSRLEHFMPKRYHWDPSEIQELGYYWFNGPKGMYPEPKVLSK